VIARLLKIEVYKNEKVFKKSFVVVYGGCTYGFACSDYAH
jgi:hypothetical protein